MTLNATIDREVHQDLVEAIEDTVEYACDHYMLSGEIVWTIVECLAMAKIAQLKREIK